MKLYKITFEIIGQEELSETIIKAKSLSEVLTVGKLVQEKLEKLENIQMERANSFKVQEIANEDDIISIEE